MCLVFIHTSYIIPGFVLVRQLKYVMPSLFLFLKMYYVDHVGSINVAELDWGNEDHIKALDPPFDFIIGTDVVSSLRLTHF